MFSKSYYHIIPVKFSPSSAPLIEVEIEGQLYPIAIDLGSKFQFALNQNVLVNINKKSHGAARWKDAKGNSYESVSYVIPKIKIGDLVLTNLVTKENPKDFISNVTLWENTQSQTDVVYEKLGSLGRPLLEKFNLLLDFSNSRIIASNSLKKLKKAGVDVKKMVKVPLENGRGIIINVNTDLGIRKFDLDTGATLNFVRASLLQNKECKRGPYGMDVFTTSKFVINKKDFGKVTLHLLEITPELHEMDGCLGMSFLKNHTVYIDYQNKVVYIGERCFNKK